VGIGTSSPTEKLHVQGNICYTGSIAGCSDIRYKKNLIPVSQILSKLQAIGVYTYSWDLEKFPDKGFTTDRQVGVIAQELEHYFPELVMTDRDGYKTVDYAKMSALLLEGLKETVAEVNQLHAQLEKVENDHAQRLSVIERKLDLRSANITSSEITSD
jgi:hypothetical protein